MQRSTFAAPAAAQQTDTAVALPSPHAPDVSGRCVHGRHSKRRDHALVHADALVAVSGAEVSANTNRQPVGQPRETSITKTELRARRAEKVRQHGLVQPQHRTHDSESLARQWNAQPLTTAPSGLQRPDDRQHAVADSSETCQTSAAHAVDAEHSMPSQPQHPSSTSCHNALISPAHNLYPRPGGGQSAVFLTAKGTTIELHSRSISTSGRDPDSEAVDSNDGGAPLLCTATRSAGGCRSAWRYIASKSLHLS